MGLNRLTDRIYFLAHEPETDRPMLAYIKGDRFSLSIDAGYSASHVQDFYKAIKSEHLKEPILQQLHTGITIIPWYACDQRNQYCP